MIGIGIDLGTSNCRVHLFGIGPDGLPVNQGITFGGVGVMPVSLQYRGDEVSEIGAHAQEFLPAGSRLIEAWKPSIGQSPDDVQGVGPATGHLLCKTPGCPGESFAYPVGAKNCMYCGAALSRPTPSVFAFKREEALRFTRDFLKRVWTMVLDEAPILRGETEGCVVCVGHPVHWRDATRARYEEVIADAVAPYKVELVPEPAAALYHHLAGSNALMRVRSHLRFPATVLVVDFGAGTTDYCVTKAGIEGTRLQLWDTHYYGEDYGGTDFDEELVNFAQEHLIKEGQLSEDDLSEALSRSWRAEAKKWKEAFSRKVQADPTGTSTRKFVLPDDRNSMPLELSKPVFEQLCSGLIQRFQTATSSAIEQSGLVSADIDLVVTTGGGARWYFVREHLQREFKSIVSDTQPEVSVCQGLSVVPTLGSPQIPPPKPPPGGEGGEELTHKVGFLVDLDYPDDRPYPLEAPLIQIGSRPGYGNHVILRDPDQVISRKQAEIIRKADGTYEMQVLRFVNPTTVDGEVVKDSAKLKDGSLISFAYRKFRFELREAAAHA